MTAPDTSGTQPARRFFLRFLRQYCIIFAVMMILSVSVHPAMAQEEFREKLDEVNAYTAQVNELKATCPGCAAALANGTLAGGMGDIGGTLTIRQIPLDGTGKSESVAGAVTHKSGNVSLTIRDQDWDEQRSQLLAGEASADGAAANTSYYNGTQAERIADFDSDPWVRTFISNVTSDGYSIRTLAVVERYGHEFNRTDNKSRSAFSGMNLSATPIVEDVARYVYTNATGYRYKFYATQVYAADMSPLGSKEVIPGGVFPPFPKEHTDEECGWAIALVVLSVIALLAAILVAIGLSILALAYGSSTGGTVSYRQEYRKDVKVTTREVPYKISKPAEFSSLRQEQLDLDISIFKYRDDLNSKKFEEFVDVSLHRPDGYVDYIRTETALAKEYYRNPTSRTTIQHHVATLITIDWALTVITMIAAALAGVLVAGFLISLALLGVTAAIMVLYLCKGWLNDQTERDYLEFRLNPEGWNKITEKDNGGITYVPVSRFNEILVKLSEKNESGVSYFWNVTSMNLNSTLLYNGDDQVWDRIWLFGVASDDTHTFSARYVREDDPAGPALKEFSIAIVPILWDPASTAVDRGYQMDTRYGTSLAIDPATDRMHIAYISYDDHNLQKFTAVGRLMYTTGTGTHWDPPVVVDEVRAPGGTEQTILEMGRTTSIALDAEGNPHIAYRDNTNGHLKYAHLLTEKNRDDVVVSKSVGATEVRNGWVVETVDCSTGHTGWGPSLAIGHDGNPRIAYLHQGGNDWDFVLKYAWWNGKAWEDKTLYHVFPHDVSCYTPVDGGGPWCGYASLVTSNIGPGEGPSLALDSADRPHISFADYARYADAVAHPDNTDRYWDRKTLSHYNDRSFRNNYNLVHLFVAQNGSWVSEFVDPEIYGGPYVHFSRHGLYSSIAIDRQDRPHISYFSYWDELSEDQAHMEYYKWTNALSWFDRPRWNHYKLGFLKYAEWNGTAWNAEQVDATSISVGEYSSLKLDAAGKPHIAYMDLHNHLLRYTTRDRPGTPWSRLLPDKKNTYTGGFSSIGLDARGNPRIVSIGNFGSVRAVFGKYDHLKPTGSRVLTYANTSVSPTAMFMPSSDQPGSPTPPEDNNPIELLPISPPDQDGTFGKDADPLRAGTNPTDQGGIAAAPAAPAGSTVSYMFSPHGSSDDLAVHAVSIVPDQAVPDSLAWARAESPLSYLRISDGPATYANIGITPENPSAIRNARIGFSVSKAWLVENHIDAADVVMMHQKGLEWTTLPTTFEQQVGDRYYYTATTPGFSYFAVTDRATAQAVMAPEKAKEVSLTAPAAGTAVSDPAIAAEVTKPAAGLSTRGAPMPTHYASSEIPAHATAAAAEPASGLPLFWIGVAGLVSMIGVAGFFIGRRMWWKHQNPNLFREYD